MHPVPCSVEDYCVMLTVKSTSADRLEKQLQAKLHFPHQTDHLVWIFQTAMEPRNEMAAKFGAC